MYNLSSYLVCLFVCLLQPPATLMEEDGIGGNDHINDSDVTASLDQKRIEESEENLSSAIQDSEPRQKLEENKLKLQEIESSTKSQEYSEESDSLDSQEKVYIALVIFGVIDSCVSI
jgi:hypothetical protein